MEIDSVGAVSSQPMPAHLSNPVLETTTQSDPPPHIHNNKLRMKTKATPEELLLKLCSSGSSGSSEGADSGSFASFDVVRTSVLRIIAEPRRFRVLESDWPQLLEALEARFADAAAALESCLIEVDQKVVLLLPITSRASTSIPCLLHTLRSQCNVVSCVEGFRAGNTALLPTLRDLLCSPLTAELATVYIAEMGYTNTLIPILDVNTVDCILSHSPTLFAILSHPPTVTTLTSKPNLSPSLSVLKNLTSTGITGILKSVIHPSTLSPTHLNSTRAKTLSLQLSILLYHSTTPQGMSTLLAYTDPHSFVPTNGTLSSTTLFTHLTSLLRVCVSLLDSKTTHNTSPSNLKPISDLVALATGAVKLLDKIKNAVYDLNLLGVVMASAAYRPICQVTKLGPLHCVAEACVGVLMISRRFRRLCDCCSSGGDSSGSSSGSRGDCTCSSWMVLESEALRVVTDLCGVVVFEPAVFPGLLPYLGHAQRMCSSRSGEEVLVLPRFFERVSGVLKHIFAWLERHPLDADVCFGVLKEVLPRGEDVAWVLKTVWTQELQIVKVALVRAVTMFISSSDKKVALGVAELVEGVSRLSSGFEFCGEFLADIVAYAVEVLAKEEGIQLDEAVELERDPRACARVLIILQRMLGNPEGVEAAAIVVAALVKTQFQSVSDMTGFGLDFVVAVARCSIRFNKSLTESLQASFVCIGRFLLTKRESAASKASFNQQLAIILNSLPLDSISFVEIQDWAKEVVSDELCSMAKATDSFDLDFKMLMTLLLLRANSGEQWVSEYRNRVCMTFQDAGAYASGHADILRKAVLAKSTDIWAELCVEAFSILQSVSTSDCMLYTPIKVPRRLISSIASSVVSSSACGSSVGIESSPATKSFHRVPDGILMPTTPQPVVVFKQYTQNQFRTNPSASRAVANVGGMNGGGGVGMGRTISNSSRAPSIHVDTYTHKDAASYQQLQVAASSSVGNTSTQLPQVQQHQMKQQQHALSYQRQQQYHAQQQSHQQQQYQQHQFLKQQQQQLLMQQVPVFHSPQGVRPWNNQPMIPQQHMRYPPQNAASHYQNGMQQSSQWRPLPNPSNSYY
ncbi:hypothetical protein BCR33DRAFT_851611 [Rhizoclosmatium globosum]|uniref:Uncharacterized protein n=1 Tax=Rhizoclosmatium globosum TaxID=329046 RepID=A0A1Y2C6Q2_9FUNG|nr:hypothetical protein BCR33DRAFT_851611 [Rhizoclosmatium globosum]|eukprot:ORY42564.1 hypothetical protein BCR33DRAFT_851611 [Rhizoclosmatium globosum]